MYHTGNYVIFSYQCGVWGSLVMEIGEQRGRIQRPSMS